MVNESKSTLAISEMSVAVVDVGKFRPGTRAVVELGQMWGHIVPWGEGGCANHESHESEFRFQLIALMESTKIAAAT